MEADNFFRGIITDVGIAKNSSKEHEIPQNLLNFNNPDIYTYAIKSPNNSENGLIVRLMNISDKELSIKIESDLNYSTIAPVNSLEKTIGKPVSIEDVIKFRPFELKTLLLEQI